jgi:hypothetical protein
VALRIVKPAMPINNISRQAKSVLMLDGIGLLSPWRGLGSGPGFARQTLSRRFHNEGLCRASSIISICGVPRRKVTGIFFNHADIRREAASGQLKLLEKEGKNKNFLGPRFLVGSLK